MPNHCSVRGCRANSKNGPREKVFCFPKDEELLKKWLHAINREDFVPSVHSKVCQRHFKPEDIVKETSAFDARKQVTITVTLKNHRLKADAVPSIFEDIPIKPRKKVKNSSVKDNPEKNKIESSVGTNMQSKNAKSPLSSVSETGVHNRQEAERKGSFKSPKKVPTTTDRPIIAVIKAEDLIMEEDGTAEKTEEEDDDDEGNDDDDDDEEEEDDDEDCVIEMQSPGANSTSSFKNLPNVSVCLKEEDRVPITRELKGVKRSPSTGSNSSTGSTDAQKLNSPLTKRRKVEKPAPVVIGRQNDCYCWVCHRENISLCCIACPRAYHPKCAGELVTVTPDWVCPECQKILAAETEDTRSSTLAEISLDKLVKLLKLSLNKMKQRAPIAFHQPVSLEHYPLYLHYVIHPMDFSLLEKNIKQKMYGCTEAFLADVKWISHNSCVFNGTQHPLSTNAKNLVKACDQDMQEIEVCPDCFVHSVVHNKYWFSEVCRKPHPLVWAKLKGFPYWPAKVVRILDGNVDARFFGAHDRAWVPVSQCYHLSKEMPTTSKPKKKGNYEVALDELNVHVHLLIQKFGSFEYAPYRTCFNPQNKFLMYHGIDIDKVSKEEISFDTSSQVPEKFHLAEKENRFASFLESEQEKLSPDESKFPGNLLEKQIKSPLELKLGLKSPLHFSERKSTELLQSSKETDEEEEEENNDEKINEEKSMLEDKTNNQTITVEEKKSDASQVSPIKISEKVSASDQFRKLELALERIKGYVSLTSEPEKENLDMESEEEKKKDDKNTSKDVNKDETKTSSSSSLFNDAVTLPVIESDNIQESSMDVTKSLETTKKTDSFFLKLNETIASCKAKLGISEITDDLSDESGADENASRSDEDEEENSSASEAEEELSDEEEEEDEEEDEVVEVSDEELENGEEENELGDKAEESEEEEEDDEESNSGTSDTDIENQNSDASPKKSYTLESDDSRNEEATSDSKDMHSIDEVTDSSVVKETDPNIQGPEVAVKDSNASENTFSEVIAESSSDVKEASSKVPFIQTSDQSATSENAQISLAAFSVQPSAKMDDSSSVIIEEGIDKSTVSDKSDLKSMQSADKILPQKDIKENQDVEMKPAEDKENSSSFLCKNEPVDEDDDIYICTPTRPKSPPVIVLDDDAENEDSSVSDTYAVKTPPYSTSVESFSNEENPGFSTNSGDEQRNTPPEMASNTQVLIESCQEDNVAAVNGKTDLDSPSPSDRRKRKLSSEDSSDDEIQIVQPVKKTALTGAKRTFNKTNSVDTLKRMSPTLESVKRNLTKETLERANISPESKSSEVETAVLRSEPTSPAQSPQDMLKSPVVDPSNLNDHQKEVLFLRRKLSCLMTAYRIQGWKCNQEREELRHNMNLIIMEMRACFESDKKQAVDALVQKYEKEKQKGIEEAKRKQWCAYCLTESRYSCCWNTSYCSVECQKRHFLEHRNSCTQIKNKNVEIKSNAASPATAENSEKRVIIVNMKPSEPGKSAADKPVTVVSQPASINKPEIQILAAKTTLQSSSTSVSTPVQFVKAPVKPTSDSNVVTSTPPLNVIGKNLDSAKIISDVRNRTCNLGKAISLLKKKNLESTLSVLTKKKEQKQKDEVSKGDSSLEDVYFPSPPKVTFEGYDSGNEEPNLVPASETEETKMDCDSEADNSELPSNATIEQDIVLSDTDDDVDNEMVNIGHGVDVKAKFLNKCLIYGTTPKKLTRCLVDIIFPDIKLLASCSAFGQKSNVTKLTRAGLPTRKVHAIIDYVIKRFPSSATRSEIVLAINMKCKEARIIVNRKDADALQKSTVRRLLAKEQEDEQITVVTTCAAITASSPTIITPVISTKNSPNVVCVKSSTQLQPVPSNLPKKLISAPGILQCTPQLLVNSKPVFAQMGSAAVLQTVPPRKKRETVKELLSKNKSLSADRPQIVMAIDAHKQSATNTQPTNAPSSSTANTRPYIIIGSPINAAKQSTSVQNPSVPASSDHKK